MKAAGSITGTALVALLTAVSGGAQDGRAVFVERGCVHCHEDAEASALAAQSPQGPDLRKAGGRLRSHHYAAPVLVPATSPSSSARTWRRSAKSSPSVNAP